MANYTKIVDYAAKDALNTGDPAKLIKGTEIGAEYDAIATAIATKANTASPAFTGVSGFAVGAVGAPSIYITGYATTGWYNIGANNWGFAVSGAKVLDIASTGLSVTGAITSTSASLHALSPLGAQAATRLYLSSADQTSATNGLIVGDSAGNNALQVKGDRSVVLGASIATVSSTGLAVTGTTSTTTGMAVGGATAGTGGIAFPAIAVAVADVNTLDDYQEGTWTPAVTFGGASVGVTYAQQVGTYTIIGDRCFGTGYITLSSKGSSVGAAKISGLPVAINAGLGASSPVSCYFDSITFADFFQAICDSGASTISLGEITNAGAISAITNSDFANNSQIIVSFQYKIA
jgi:hypothetical protein